MGFFVIRGRVRKPKPPRPPGDVREVGEGECGRALVLCLGVTNCVVACNGRVDRGLALEVGMAVDSCGVGNGGGTRNGERCWWYALPSRRFVASCGWGVLPFVLVVVAVDWRWAMISRWSRAMVSCRRGVSVALRDEGWVVLFVRERLRRQAV